MTAATIARASSRIDELLLVLDDAYWEAGHIYHKDMLYSIIALLHTEQRELDKLSVQDHELVYEPISSEFRELKPKLTQLRRIIEELVPRSKTARALERAIPDVAALLH